MLQVHSKISMLQYVFNLLQLAAWLKFLVKVQYLKYIPYTFSGLGVCSSPRKKMYFLGILAHLVRWWLWWSHHLLNKVFRFREGDWFPIGYWTWWKWEIFPASHLAIVVENQPSSNLPRKEKCRPRATAWCNEATDFDPSWKGEPVYSSRGVCTGGWGGSSKWLPWIERSGFLGVYFFCLWKQLEHKELGFCWERWV